MKLLLVEDDQALNRSLTKLLKKQDMQVDSAFDGQEALDFLDLTVYDLVILDVMMPYLDGFGLLEKLRQAGNDQPVLFLTARDSLEDRIRGLDLGADDYLVKPFEFEELLARMRAILRRHYKEVTSQLVDLGHIQLDLDKKSVTREGERMDLTAKEYQLLELLARHRGQILSRDQIRERLWDFDYEGESNLIDVLIRNLRRKLDKEGQESVITTKRGLGYVLY